MKNKTQQPYEIKKRQLKFTIFARELWFWRVTAIMFWVLVLVGLIKK